MEHSLHVQFTFGYVITLGDNDVIDDGTSAYPGYGGLI